MDDEFRFDGKEVAHQRIINAQLHSVAPELVSGDVPAVLCYPILNWPTTVFVDAVYFDLLDVAYWWIVDERESLPIARMGFRHSE